MVASRTIYAQGAATHSPSAMLIETCRQQTSEHIRTVQGIICWFAEMLLKRGAEHDRSKLGSPELEGFAFRGRELSGLEYGSEEYQANLIRLNEILSHHYAANRHHPEHFVDGVDGMNLIDVVEMFCDWMASARRNKGGNIYRSIEVGAERFQLDPQLVKILINTADALGGSYRP